MTTHILALGGGGFSMSNRGEPTALDRHILDLSGKSSPLVCFAPTAAADDPVYVNRFLAAYSALGVRTMVLTLWQGAAESVERLSQADVIVSGAGSAANLMALWRMHGVDHVIRRMTSSADDVVLAGVAAGAACWFSGCLTDAFGDLRAWRGGMGLLDGSFCPHFDGEWSAPRSTHSRLPMGVSPLVTQSMTEPQSTSSTVSSPSPLLSVRRPRSRGSPHPRSRPRRESCARSSTSPCCDIPRLLIVVEVLVAVITPVGQVREEVCHSAGARDVIEDQLV